MTIPNLTQPVRIASVLWPAHKALAVLIAALVLVAASMLAGSAQLGFALSMASGMLVWWIFSPSSPLIRSR